MVFDGNGEVFDRGPSGDNWDPGDPASWNMYSYAEADPVNLYDPTGLSSCGNGVWSFAFSPAASQNGQSLNSIIDSGSNLGLVAETIFTGSAESTTYDGSLEMGAIGAVIMNRWQILNGYYWLRNTTGNVIQVSPDWGPPSTSLAQIMQNPNQLAVWGSGGSLSVSAHRNLDAALDSDIGSSPCDALDQAFFTSALYLSDQNQHALAQYNGLVLTSFNSFEPAHSSSTWETTVGSFGSANTFYGIPLSQTEYVPTEYGSPIPLQPRRPGHRPPGRRRPLALAGR